MRRCDASKFRRLTSDRPATAAAATAATATATATTARPRPRPRWITDHDIAWRFANTCGQRCAAVKLRITFSDVRVICARLVTSFGQFASQNNQQDSGALARNAIPAGAFTPSLGDSYPHGWPSRQSKVFSSTASSSQYLEANSLLSTSCGGLTITGDIPALVHNDLSFT